MNAPDTYQVTVKNSAATNSGAGFYEADQKPVTIHAGSRSNYTFIGWTTSSGRDICQRREGGHHL